MAQLELSLASAPAARRARARVATSTEPIRREKRSAPQLNFPLEQETTGGDVRGVVRIEAVLRSVIGPKVLVQITQNRSTMISFNRRRGVLYVRMHSIFADASEDVLAAVAAYAAGKRINKATAALIDDYIDHHRHLVKQPEPDDVIVQPVGEAHDLQSIMEALNQRYFGARVKARITWSRAGRNLKRHSIRMGSYCDDQSLIRIHPALDQEFVPTYFVAAVVFHEMLHELHGVEERDGRRCVHTKAFLAEERRFDDYEKAQRWESKHLHKLLRY